MNRYAALLADAHARQLDIFGAFHPEPGDGTPEGTGTVILYGPHEPGFWDAIQDSPEWTDRQGDAIDRWSLRVITGMAHALGGTALFPFGGPPWNPFIAWAKRSGRAWESPVSILVHDRAGLMVSYRGAIALNERIGLPQAGPRPCDTCVAKPCMNACPAVALTSQGYDIPACKTYLLSETGKDCLNGGCQVRRSCPVSQSYGRLPEQSGYHMSHFV